MEGLSLAYAEHPAAQLINTINGRLLIVWNSLEGKSLII